MKKLSRFIFLFLLCVLCATLFTPLISAAGKVREPEAIGVFYWLNNGSLVQLERQTAVIKVMFRETAELKGERSPIRIKSGQKQEFIVQLANGVDPNKYSLNQFKVKNGKRQVVLTKAMLLGAKSEVNTIFFNVSKYGSRSYKIVPAETLPPGEYGFNPSESDDVFCFGID